jgi:very-short-patch-repair endonuclease
VDLQRLFWSWELVPALVRPHAPAVATLLAVACRPIATDRRRDGVLVAVVGCWLPGYQRTVADAGVRALLTNAVATAVGEPVRLELVDWPAGMLPPQSPEARAAEQAIAALADPPPVLAPPAPAARQRLSPALQAELAKCESVLERLLFTQLIEQGLSPHCQYRLGALRLDFAFPSARLGLDIDGWERRAGPLSEREAELRGHGWRLLWCFGREVAENAPAIARRVVQLLGGQR